MSNLDLTTAIYLVKGFMSNAMVFEKASKAHSLGGELELLTEVGNLSQSLDKAFEETGHHRLDGVFAYKIAEPMGLWMALFLSENKELPSPDTVYKKTESLLNQEEFYTLCDQAAEQFGEHKAIALKADYIFAIDFLAPWRDLTEICAKHSEQKFLSKMGFVDTSAMTK